MPAKTLILDGLLQGNLDCAGYKLVNVDISNITPPVTFGPVAAHTVFAGPVSGPNAVPAFRLMTAAEFGAQPYATTLEILSNTIPSNLGLAILQITDTLVPGYVRATGSDTPPFASFFTPTQVRTDIQAQPLSPALTILSPLTISTLGTQLVSALSVGGGYLKVGPAVGGNVPSFFNAAQVAADIAPSIIPFVDDIAHVKNKAVPTKLFRIDASLITAPNTRVMSVPDYNFTPATIAGPEAIINKVVNGMTLKVGTAAGGGSEDLIAWSQTPLQPMQFGLVDTSGSGAELVLRLSGPVDMVVRDGTAITTETTIPASAGAAGVLGQTAYDTNFEYRCVGTNTWKRTPLSTWP